MNDARGYPIQVGDIVAYPGRKGSSCWLTPARVIQIREEGHFGIQVHPVDPRTDAVYKGEKPRWVWGIHNVVRLHSPLPTERIN